MLKLYLRIYLDFAIEARVRYIGKNRNKRTINRGSGIAQHSKELFVEETSNYKSHLVPVNNNLRGTYEVQGNFSSLEQYILKYGVG